MKTFMPAVAALAVVLHVAGCDREAASPASSHQASAPLATPDSAASVSGGLVEAGTPEAMLEAWRKAMEGHAFATARSYFGDTGAASGMSESAFSETWGKYRIIDMTIGAGRSEGAAGSLFYQAPVTVTGVTREGKPYHLSGTVTVRRVNGVPGATPEQLRWHIASTTLRA